MYCECANDSSVSDGTILTTANWYTALANWVVRTSTGTSGMKTHGQILQLGKIELAMATDNS